MSRGGTGTRASTRGFPRVSGDEPVEALTYTSLMVFSPRERG